MGKREIELWIDCRFCLFSPCVCAELEILMRKGITPEIYARLWVGTDEDGGRSAPKPSEAHEVAEEAHTEPKEGELCP